MNFSDCVALVTGGSSGIGAATVCWLLSDEASFVSGQTLGVDGAQSAA